MDKKEKSIQETENLLSFLKKCTSPFHAVNECEKRLIEAGFLPLFEGDAWNLERGQGYFVSRNRSSLIAFRTPSDSISGFMVSAAHTDSPTFRVKREATADVSGGLLRLNTEGYGGMICSSWLDRPLSVAGRLTVREPEDGTIKTVLVSVDRDLLIIPNVAIHFNRTINDGYKYNPASDLQPLVGTSGKGDFLDTVAKEANVEKENILSFDLELYDRTPGVVFGLDSEFFSSGRIDNLECTYGTLCGFLASSPLASVCPVFCSFDNEETGSLTKQGADSDFLSSVLSRISNAYHRNLSELVATSFMVSSDNAHARHPNHPEYSDGKNAPDINRGIVIKHNAAQHYTTDAVSDAIFSEICKRAGAPVQHFYNRSDMRGGSTLGNISSAHIPFNTVDIGLAQFAMHSAYETAGCLDLGYLVDAMTRFFSSGILSERDGEYRISD